MRPLRAYCRVSSLNGVCSAAHDVNSVSERKVDGKVTINPSLNKRSTGEINMVILTAPIWYHLCDVVMKVV